MRTALLSMAIVLAGLLVLLALESSPEPKQDISLTTLAHRVETLRGLRFSTVPVPVKVSGDVAQREGLEDVDRSYPAARRHADEAILRRLGLIDPGVDLRAVSASLYGEGGVAGYYDPRSKASDRHRCRDRLARPAGGHPRPRADARAGGSTLRALAGGGIQRRSRRAPCVGFLRHESLSARQARVAVRNE